jgi:ribulose-5-phosphate 4-epimerase/fuculose-1-phosphate aldolase
MLEQFAGFGRELFLHGVNSSHSGNMSVRAGDRIFITRRGSMLSNLVAGDAAMVRGHGSFAVGQMLEEAFQWTSSLEASCKTLYLHRLLTPREQTEVEGRW